MPVKTYKMHTKISAVIITRNEELKLGDCLKSISFVDEIIIIDSGSTDQTEKIAKSYGAQFIYRQFDNFENQKNAAINKATGDWLILIDADERIPPELKNELLAFFDDPNEYTGAWFWRENVIFGKKQRFGANARDRQLRVLKAGYGMFQGAVHERIQLQGNAYQFNTPLIHITYQTKKEYFDKFDFYIQLELQQMKREKRRVNYLDLWLRPVGQFIKNYILRLGFLDGWTGFKFHAYSAYYTFEKYKRYRLKNFKSHV